MTKWNAVHGEILDVTADGLLCSANPSLNLSGGVGGAFLLRYGSEMQSFLHAHLHTNQLRYIEPGAAVTVPPCGSPYLAVAHAVAIDAFYDTSPSLILDAYTAAIGGLANAGCRSIAAACLGCGYGRLPPEDFVKSMEPLVSRSFDSVDTFAFVTTNKTLAVNLQEIL